MASVLNAPTLKSARQALFNMRQMSLAFTTVQSMKHSIALYNDHHYCKGTQGTYQIDAETLQFKRTDPLEDPLISNARQVLRSPLPYQLQTAKMANPRQPMSVALGDESTAIRVPIGPVTAPLAERRVHTLNRKPQGAIQIPLSELRLLAMEMDAREAGYPERRQGNWASRLQRFALMVPKLARDFVKKKCLS
jgi:hypothetical protein